MDLKELTVLNHLNTQLKPNELTLLRDIIELPEGLCADLAKEANFIVALKKWTGLDPYLFYMSLTSIRPDLVDEACKVKWLCVSSPDEVEHIEKKLSIETLIELLKNELSKTNLKLIDVQVGPKGDGNFEITMNKLLEQGLIWRDLSTLKKIFSAIGRQDLIKKVEEYLNTFSLMKEEEFEREFEREINKQPNQSKQWEQKLKDYSKTQYKQVKQMLVDDQSVRLEDVFVELTILKQKPRAINMEDETTYSEIAYLTKIANKANKEVEITSVDFTNELLSYEPSEPEIWCIIANPGIGKTFLAKKTAFMVSRNEFVGIHYTISIPCRNPDWHTMESTRYEEGKEVKTEFIQRWLCLGLPMGPSWCKYCSKHFIETDGQGLLLIIDALDEFTGKVPFGKTFLCLLLTRQCLTKSTIILTSRPWAWTDISRNHELRIDRYYQILGFSPESRDRYFEKQIENEKKLKACMSLMERHDELKLMSLIPVNASLFAALLKGEDYASIDTLTKLYCELTNYLIRREVSKIGLKEFYRISRVSDLHPDIQACLKTPL